MEDELLIQRGKRGCNESFEKLIKDRGEKMYKLAYSYVKNETIALEVVSEATFKSYIHIHKVREIQYFDTWLCKIVINEALTRIKKEKKLISLESQHEQIEPTTHKGLEEKVDLYDALEYLKEEEKEIITMKYFGDVTFTHIGQALNKSEGTVKTIHYRALKKIKKILEGG